MPQTSTQIKKQPSYIGPKKQKATSNNKNKTKCSTISPADALAKAKKAARSIQAFSMGLTGVFAQPLVQLLGTFTGLKMFSNFDDKKDALDQHFLRLALNTASILINLAN